MIDELTEKMLSSMKDEFTEKMHSEFDVDEETEIKLRVGSVWGSLSRTKKMNDPEKLKYECKLYDVTVEQAMKYKSYWSDVYK